MKKIRINELARELEVKAHEILERLPELGVSEKKTHSSSIDEDVAIKLRQYYGQDIPDYVHDPNADDSAGEGHEELGLDWKTVKELDKQYMREQVKRMGRPAPLVIGIDEVSI